MKIYISSSSKRLKDLDVEVAIEAEYGQNEVRGKLVTLNHHGPRRFFPAPCEYPNFNFSNEQLEELIIGISHVDLDTLGGIMAILGKKKEENISFWRLASFIDVNGAHKLNDFNHSDEDEKKLYAFWAYSQKKKIFPPRNGEILDVTDNILEMLSVIEKILDNDPKFIQKGEEFKKQTEELNKHSFVKKINNIIIRKSDSFVNNLYNTPDGELKKAVIAFNSKFKSITVSLADPIEGINIGLELSKIFGPEAGGHASIGGSPRGQEMTEKDFEKAIKHFSKLINK